MCIYVAINNVRKKQKSNISKEDPNVLDLRTIALSPVKP